MMPWEDEDRMIRALEAKDRTVCAGIVRAVGTPTLAVIEARSDETRSRLGPQGRERDKAPKGEA